VRVSLEGRGGGSGACNKQLFLYAAMPTAEDEEVELQLQRIADAIMPEYRREATGLLKELLLDNPRVRAHAWPSQRASWPQVGHGHGCDRTGNHGSVRWRFNGHNSSMHTC
jgi:hypothetical protein